MILHEMPANDSHEITCHKFAFFEKAAKFEIAVCCNLKMALYGLKTYAANFHAHHSCVSKQVKRAGSCLSTIYKFRSTQILDTLM